MKKALLSLPFAARLRESSIRLLLTMSEFIEFRASDRLPFSYHLCTTRHARHSFSLDYSPKVVVLTNPVHMDVKPANRIGDTATSLQVAGEMIRDNVLYHA